LAAPSRASTVADFFLLRHSQHLRPVLALLEGIDPIVLWLWSMGWIPSLRVHAPVPATIRVAMKDDVIPLNIPFVDKLGRMQYHVKCVCYILLLTPAVFVTCMAGYSIRKGEIVVIPIIGLNKAKHLWGENALEFMYASHNLPIPWCVIHSYILGYSPERWESIPGAVASIPGVWGNMMTFLGGSRACIGYRFSLLEMKALLFTLVRAFEFELAVSAEDIGTRTTIVQRPVILSEPGARGQMPLLVKPYQGLLGPIYIKDS